MRILLIAPQLSDRPQVVGALSVAGYEVVVVEAASEPAQLPEGRVDVLFVDLASPDTLRFIKRSPALRAGTPIVCIADRRNPEASAEALRLGVADIVGRPLLLADVVAAVANALEMTGVARSAAPAPAAPEPAAATDAQPLFGASPAMRDVIAIVRRVAQSRCAVMIVGERGTGREMIARAIHTHGQQRDRPFLKVVCADATSDEVDQVLHGAVPDGSTVYLEDLAELPEPLQMRLEGRLRGPAAHDHVRFTAGALPRVALAVERGHLRNALVEALSVVRIDLPPLRERPQDIPLLAMHFLKQACRRGEQPAKTFSPTALALLAALPWPGNAGELRSLAERLAVLVPRGVVLLEDILAHVRLDGGEAAVRTATSLREAREQFERHYVAGVLEHHRGRVGSAARELGIERTNLYRKIKQLKIRLP